MPVRLFKTTTPIVAVVDEEHEHRDQPGHEGQLPGLNLDPRIRADRVEIVSIEQVKPNSRNAKRHPERQIAAIAAVIDTMGFRVPIIVDENNQI